MIKISKDGKDWRGISVSHPLKVGTSDITVNPNGKVTLNFTQHVVTGEGPVENLDKKPITFSDRVDLKPGTWCKITSVSDPDDKLYVQWT